MAKERVKPMTHEERQELIRRPIVFNYIGGKTSGGVGSSGHLGGYIERTGTFTGIGPDNNYYEE